MINNLKKGLYVITGGTICASVVLLCLAILYWSFLCVEFLLLESGIEWLMTWATCIAGTWMVLFTIGCCFIFCKTIVDPQED